MIFAVILYYFSSSEWKAWKIQARTRLEPWIFQAFHKLLLKQHNVTAKIINIKNCFHL